MKKTYVFLLILLVSLIAGTLSATTLLTDDFTGTVGTNLMANGWSLHSGSTSPILITSPSLTYTGYLGSGVGNAAAIAGTSDDVNKAFTSTNSGTLYNAFMLNISAMPNTTLDYNVMLTTTSGTTGVTVFYGKLYVQRDASNNVRFGITKQTAASVNWSSYTYAYATTYLLVVKYEFIAGAANDIASLFINPTLGGAEPTPTLVGLADAASDPAQLVAVAIRESSNTPPGVIDGFMIATTWADVAPPSLATEPTDQPDNMTFANTTSSFFDVLLDAAIPAADGYIAVRKAGSASTTDPVDGTAYALNDVIGDGVVAYVGSALTFPNSGLNPLTTYYFKVYSYNGTGTSTNYLLTIPLEGNHATLMGIVVPTVTTDAITNIGSITATGGGNVTADGNGTVDARGVCWNTTGSPTIGDSFTSDSNGLGAFTSSLTPLNPNQLYYVRAYAHNSAGYAYGGEVQFTTYKAEPVAYPTGFVAGTLTVDSIQLNWTDSVADGYLIKGSAVSYASIVAPVDFTPEVDAALVHNVLPGAQTYTFTGLTGGATYYFQIYPYNNSGTHIDFKTDGTAPQVSATTLSTPVLTVAPLTMTMDAYVGTSAYPVTATVTSSNLSAGITVASTGPFTFSETVGGTYSNPLLLIANYNGSVFVKFSPVSVGTFTQLITFDSGASHAEIAPTANGVVAPTSPFLVENFVYTPGTTLVSNGWSAHNGAGVASPLVDATNLTYTGYPPNAGGSARTTGVTGEDVSKGFTAQTYGDVYCAFLINITSLPNTTQDYCFHLGDSAVPGGGTTFKGRLYVQKNASNQLRFGISKSVTSTLTIPWTGGPFTGGTFDYAMSTTYLMVIKYKMVPGLANDEVSLWINPVTGPTEPAYTLFIGSTDTTSDPTNIGSVAIRQSSNTPAAYYDGIKIAYSWADLFAVPAPTLNVTGSFTPFTTTVGNPSVAQTITVYGTNLTASINVSCPAGYELSTDTANWSSTLTLASNYNGPVDVRLTGTTEGNFSGNVSFTSTGATPIDLPVNGTVNAATGFISAVWDAPLTDFNALTGGYSAIQSYTLTGTDLTDFLYVVPASAVGGTFEVRDATGAGSWQTGLSLSPFYSGTIEVRFTATTPGTFAGTITHISDGATDVVLNVTGVAINPTPALSVEPAAMSFVAPAGDMSASQVATVTSANLSAGITVASASEYVFCATIAGTYLNPLVLATNYNGPVYIKYAPTTIGGPFVGSVTFTSGVVSDAITTSAYCLDPNQTYANDLFFSEYIEGTSNNKAIEIFNGTGAPVDLTDYTVYLYSNGSPTPTNTLAMTGILANNDVYCITNASAALLGITSNSDITSTVTFYNGDDALSIWKESTSSYVDIFGVIDDDPGSMWVDGSHQTLDRTLVRKSTVIGGVTVNPSGTGVLSFVTMVPEWDVYPTDTVSNFGSHYFTPGMTVAEAPVFTPPAGIQVAPIGLVMTSTTPGAQIRYTLDGNEPTETSALYGTPIPLSATTTVKAKTYATGYAASGTTIGVYTFPVIIDVPNIAALRAITLPSTSYYRLTGEAVLTLKSATRHAKYIQDATGAVLIDDATGKITTNYNIGDGITGIIGTLAVYTRMLQFTPATDPGAPTSTGNVIAPLDVTWAAMDTTYQGKLVKFSSLSFVEAGIFAGSTTYNTTSPSGAGVVRTQYVDLDYIGTTIPTTPKNIVGVMLQYNTVMQFVPRSLAEFTDAAPLVAPVNVVATVVGNDIQLTWDNDPAVTSWKVYVADDPYGTFTFVANATTNSYLLVGEASTYGKRFYYVTANN